MQITAVCLCFCALWLPAAWPALSQSPAITKAFIGADGLVHVEKQGRETVFRKESDQVSVDSLKVAPDGRAAGWLVDEPNCCTSYPIPTRLVVDDGGKHVLREGQMIYDWCFVAGGRDAALSIGPTHGESIRHFLLYDARSGRRLQEWSAPDSDAPPPSWASGLRQ